MKVALLTFIWILLREEISLVNILIGIIISIACITYSKKFLPFNKIGNVNILKLIIYMFYLLGQVYIAGFFVIKKIVSGNARADFVITHTALRDESLRVILADSITLTPGSILLDLTDNRITVVLLVDKDAPRPLKNADEIVKGHLENKLLLIEK